MSKTARLCYVLSFQLHLYSASLQLMKQHSCRFCLPLGSDGTAVCGSMLSTVQCGRGKTRQTPPHVAECLFTTPSMISLLKTHHVICPPYHCDNLTPSPLNHHLISEPSHPLSSASPQSLLSSRSLVLNIQFTVCSHCSVANCTGLRDRPTHS